MPFPAPFAGHSNRKKFTLDATLVSADKTGFDIVVSITDLDLRDIANTNGLDIQFADDADNLLDFEIQTWIPSTGRLVAWIKVPSLSSSTDTPLKMYFGKASATDVSDAPSLWSDWECVYHLQESGSGSQGEYVNSVGNGHDAGGGFDGTSFGVNGTPAKDGGGLSAPPFADSWQYFDDALDSGTQNIGCLGVWPEHDAPWGTMTSMIWINPDNSGDDRIWGLSYGLGDEDNTFLHNKRPTSGGRYHGRIDPQGAGSGTGFLSAAVDFKTGQWQMIVASIDFSRSASDECIGYTDGVNTGDFGVGGTTFVENPDVDFRTMGNGGVTYDRGLDGGIAEARLREAPADADDVSIWWENQSDPGAFHTFDVLEFSPLDLADTVAVSDAVAVVVTYKVSQTDTVLISDAIAEIYRGLVAASDTVALTDAVLEKLIAKVSESDTVALSDAVTAVAKYLEALNDTVGLADAVQAFVRILEGLSDTVAVSDALADLYRAIVIIGDTMAVADMVEVFEPIVVVGDVLPLSGVISIVAKYLITETDTVSLADVLAVLGRANISESDTVALADALLEKYTAKVNETDVVGLADAVAVVSTQKVTETDTVSLADAVAVAAKFKLSQTDTVLVSDAVAVIVRMKVAETDNLPLSDAILIEENIGEMRTEVVSINEILTTVINNNNP